MIKKDLVQRIEEYNTLFLAETTQLREEFSHEHLRLRRVCIKTYKALYLFVLWSNNLSEQKPINKKLKKIYKISGESRKWRVNKKKSKKLLSRLSKKDIVNFQNFCTKKTIKAQDMFEGLLSMYEKDFFETQYEPVQSFFKKTTKLVLEKKYQGFKEYVIGHINDILSKDSINEDDLHDIRKEAKHLLYFADLFQDSTTDDYKKISKLLGRWNDAIELNLSLKQWNKKYGSKNVKRTIKEHKKDILQQKKNILAFLSTHFTS